MTKSVRRSHKSKVTRTRSIDRCIADGEKFLERTKEKRIIKTRAVTRAIAEAEKAEEERRKRAAPKVRATKRRVTGRRPIRPARRALPAPPAMFGPPRPAISSSLFPAATTVYSVPSVSNGTIFTKSSIPSKDLAMPAFGFIDVCFCLDATFSMYSELAQVKSTIASLIHKISNKVQTEGITLRFAIVAYHDHCDAVVLRIQDFTDAVEATKFSESLNANGGGDEPEAAHDGLLAACKQLTWMEVPHTPTLRYIFHILDAPPHGKEFDTHEANEGCTCGISTDTVLNEMNAREIHYRMIKVRNNPRVDKTEQIFKKRLGNFDSADIGHAKEMDVRVSDMVIHEIMPQF